MSTESCPKCHGKGTWLDTTCNRTGEEVRCEKCFGTGRKVPTHQEAVSELDTLRAQLAQSITQIDDAIARENDLKTDCSLLRSRAETAEDHLLKAETERDFMRQHANKSLDAQDKSDKRNFDLEHQLDSLSADVARLTRERDEAMESEQWSVKMVSELDEQRLAVTDELLKTREDRDRLTRELEQMTKERDEERTLREEWSNIALRLRLDKARLTASREAMRGALERARLYVEQAMPDMTGHVCGPDAGCDGICMDASYCSDALGQIEAALASDPGSALLEEPK